MATDHNFKVKKGIDVLGGDVNLGDGFAYKIDGTTVVDSSRNLSNISTVSSGAITSSGTITGTQFLASGSDSTPAGTTFANTVKGVGTHRTMYFDGQSSGGVSTWYGVGNNPYAAIDVVEGALDIWVNPSSGSWHNVADFGTGGLRITYGQRVLIDVGGTAYYAADGGTNHWKYLSLQTNGTSNWDIATKNDDLSGALQFRPSGGPTNRTYMDTSGNWTMQGDLTVSGNLTVNGTQTTLNTATLQVEDKNIILNYGSGNTSASANGAGITIQDAVNSTTDATLTWDATNDEWDFSHGVNITGGLLTSSAVAFGNSTVDPDAYGSYAGGFGHIADGGGWGARGLFIHGGSTGDAAAIGHNGSSLYFGIQNGSAANSMATWLTVNTSRVATFAAQVTVEGPIVTTHGSGGLTISGDTSGNNYIEGSGEFRFRPAGTSINKFVIGSNGNLTTAGTISSGAITATGTTTLSGLTVDGAASVKHANSSGFGNQTFSWFAEAFDAFQIYNDNSTSSASADQFASLYMRADGAGNASARMVLRNDNSGNGRLYFMLRGGSHTGITQPKMLITDDGQVTISTNATTYNERLFVDGNLRVEGVYKSGNNTIIDASRNLTNIGTISSGAITSSGSLTVTDFVKASGNNLKFSAGGNHIMNIDLNGKIYPQTDNHTDLGFSATAARFRNLNLSGNIAVGGSTVIDSSRAITSTAITSTALDITHSSADSVLRIAHGADNAHDAVIQLSGSAEDMATEGAEIWYDNNVGDVHIATTYVHDNAYIRFHTRTGASKSTSNERLTIAGHGTIGINKSTGLDSGYKLDMGGHIKMNNNHIHYVNQLHFNDNMRFVTSTSQELKLRAGGSSSGIRFTHSGGDSTRGYVWGNSDDGNSIGFLDSGGSWAVRHINDQGTIFYSDTGTTQASIGSDLISGDYGSMTVTQGKGGWSGYSINNQWVFMSEGTSRSGIYNDTDNEWAAQFYRNGQVSLYHNNLVKLSTTTDGIDVAGDVKASSSLYVRNRKILDTPSNSSSERGPWNPIASSIRTSGRMLHVDEDFATGGNGVGVYNNAGGSAVTITREDDSTTLGATAPNSSGKVLKIVYNAGSSSPGFGGFVQTIPAEDNHTFVQIFQAKLPSGRTFYHAENAQGTNNLSYWLTSQAGTGKWEWYIRVSHCGDSGTFSGGGHVYVAGGTNGAFTWYLASCTCFDVTETPAAAKLQYQNSASNLYIPSESTGATGILSKSGAGAFRFQVYGDGTNYGFLDGEWAGWDLKKASNGNFEVDEGSGLQRVWNAGNDGTGSGLDADTLDGQQLSYVMNYDNLSNKPSSISNSDTVDGLHAASFVRSDADDTATGKLYFTGGSSTSPALHIKSGGTSWSEGLAVHPLADSGYSLAFFRTKASFTDRTNTWAIGNLGGTGFQNYFGLLRKDLTGGVADRTSDAIFTVNPTDGRFKFGFNPYVGSNKIWHAGNDGPSSGLDADLLDGQHGSYYRNAGNLNAGTLPDARLSSSVFRHRGTINVTTSSGGSNSNPFDDAHTETKVSEYGTRLLSYTGASATMMTIATGGSASVFQIGAHYNGNDFYMRTRTDSSNWQTWKKLWHAGNDGSGSGLDADLLDGQHGSYYAPVAGSTSFRPVTAGLYGTGHGSSMLPIWQYNSSHHGYGFGYVEGSPDSFRFDVTNNLVSGTPDFEISENVARVNGNTVWHAGNDGSGSGLDADRLDGLNSGIFFKSATNDNGGWSQSNRNFSVRSGGSAAGLHMEESDGTFALQLYGDSSQYGFLDSEWGNWDIKKTANGNFYVDEGSGLQRVWNAGNDGTGSGLDADLLDGQHGSYYRNAGNLNAGTIPEARIPTISKYLRSDTSDTMSGELNVTRNGGTTGSSAPQYSNVNIELQTSSNHVPGISFHRGGYSATTLYEYDGELYVNAWTTRNQTGKLVSFGNDGTGSGLDADLLDGQHGSYYAAASHVHSYLPLAGGTITGNLNVNGTTTLGNGNADQTHINDTLYLGATDSGDSHFYFGENSSNWYGEHWYWDSGYTTNRYSRHAGTDTLIEKHDTRYTHKLQTNRSYERLGHSIGYQIGSYNSVGANSNKTNPIYTIGENYRPTDTSFSNMYGIGYAHPNIWGTSNGMNMGWGQYVVEAGVVHFIAGISGTWSKNEFNRNGNKVWDAGNDGPGSGLDADTVDGKHASDFMEDQFLDSAYVDFTVNGDADTYYPVSIRGGGVMAFQMYSISRQYNWTAPNTWYTSTHRGGLTLTWQFSGDGFWGGNDHDIRIIKWDETYSTMVAGMGGSVGGGGTNAGVVVWLRGGGAQYRFHGPQASAGDVNIHLSSVTASNSTVFAPRSLNTTTRDNELLPKYPIRNKSDLYDNNNRVWHVGNDGPGSGLDADTVDGQGESVFMRKFANSDLDMNDYNIHDVTNVRTNPANADVKFSVWDGLTYGIGMTSGVTLGHLNDYAMTFCMNNDSDRGFWWGYEGQGKGSGAMSLTTGGKLWVTSDVTTPKILSGQNYQSNTPRYDTSFYVAQSQHFYGHNSSQTIYLGETGNPTRIRGAVHVGSDTSAPSGYRFSIGGAMHGNNNDINYVNQLHFNDNVRFYDDGNDSYLNFKYGDTGAGGFKMIDGSNNIDGYFYADGGNIGILPPDGGWGLRVSNSDCESYHNFRIPAGSATAPSLTSSGDTNTGVFMPGSDVFKITTGGVNAVTVNNSDIQLIRDTVSVKDYLRHYGDTDTHFRFTTDRIRMVAGNVTFMDATEGATDYLRFPTRAVTIGSNTNPQATFTIDQGCTETPANGCGTGNDAHMKLENTNTTGSASTCIIFNAKDSGGNMRHGAGIQFKKAIAWSANGQYPGELYFWTRPTSGNQAAAQKLDKDGNAIFKGNVTAYGSLSDRRLKENIENIPDATKKVQELNGVTFNYKKDGKKATGLIAQELQEVLPEAVYTSENIETGEEHLAIHYGNVIGLLVESIKELKAEIEDLKNDKH